MASRPRNCDLDIDRCIRSIASIPYNISVPYFSCASFYSHHFIAEYNVAESLCNDKQFNELECCSDKCRSYRISV
jgi:hypothetical protein